MGKRFATPWQDSRPKSRGRCKGGGASSKAKGRSAVLKVRDLLLAWFPLRDDDVLVKATSQGGCDLHLSPVAQNYFPFSPEVKNAERLQIWAALQQAAMNASGGRPPILLFKRAHTDLYVALRAEDFLRFVTEVDR